MDQLARLDDLFREALWLESSIQLRCSLRARLLGREQNPLFREVSIDWEIEVDTSSDSAC